MKKFFLIVLISVFFMMFFSACDLDGEGTTLKIQNESSKIIYDVLWNNIAYGDKSSEFNGTWTGTYPLNANHPAGEIEVEIGDGSWSVLFKDEGGAIQSASGLLGNKTGNLQYLIHPNTSHSTIDAYRCGNISLSGNKLILNLTIAAVGVSSEYFPLVNRRETYELTKLGDSFKPGTNITKTVEHGSGYIFFKIGTTAYRTQSLVVVEKGEDKNFVFNDYTLVVDITDPGTVKILSEL